MPNKQHEKALHLASIIVIFILFGFLSLLLGQDTNWDLHNYHFYNAYSFLNNRLRYDLAPAQLQSYHNPILYLPQYWLIKYFVPKQIGFILGGVQGLNIYLLILIHRTCLQQTRLFTNTKWFLFLTTATATLSPIFFSELGTSFGDNLASLPILLSLYLLLGTISLPLSNSRYNIALWIAWFLLGLSAGLKLTNFTFAFAAYCAYFLNTKTKSISRLISSGTCIFVGILCSSGAWMLSLYEKFGNPLFPYYNAYFKSPFFPSINFKDSRWVPIGIIDGFSYPFQWALGYHPSLEVSFLDIRWAVYIFLFMLLGCLLIVRFFQNRKIKAKKGETPLSSLFLLLFTSLSFLIWLYIFGYSRYLLAVDLLCPISMVCIIDILFSNYFPIQWLSRYLPFDNKTRFARFTTSLLLLLIIFTAKIPDWGRSAWRESWFGPTALDKKLHSSDIVLLFSNKPMSFIIPYLPPEAHYVRLEGNMFMDSHYIENTRLGEEIRSWLNIDDSNYYALAPLDYTFKENMLAKWGKDFSINISTCRPIYTNLDTFKFCKFNSLSKL